MAHRIEDRITFIHVPKNAGTSIVYFFKENYKTQSLPTTHATWSQLPKEWQDNTFCVVRNPYDRVVSLYKFQIKVLESKQRLYPNFINPQLEELSKGFKNYIMNCKETVFKKHPTHNYVDAKWTKRQQIKYLSGNFEKINILRYENLEKDFTQLLMENRIKQNRPLQKLNVSRSNNDYKQFYDTETRKEVEKFYQEDIDILKYKF